MSNGSVPTISCFGGTQKFCRGMGGGAPNHNTSYSGIQGCVVCPVCPSGVAVPCCPIGEVAQTIIFGDTMVIGGTSDLELLKFFFLVVIIVIFVQFCEPYTLEPYSQLSTIF